MIRTALTATAVFLGASSAAMSGELIPPSPTETVYSENDTTRAFVGLNFTFGAGGVTPEAVLGVAHGTTDVSNDFTGARASLHFDIWDGFGLRSGKLSALSGDRDLQGELGLGYNFERQAPFGIAGVNGEHFQAGADIGFDGVVEGYVGVHSLGEFDARVEEEVPLILAPPVTLPE
jgi:hypothetical protein